MKTKKEKIVITVSLCLFTVIYGVATLPLPQQNQAILPSVGAPIYNELLILLPCVVILGFYFAMKKTQNKTAASLVKFNK